MPKKTVDTGSSVTIPSMENLIEVTRKGISIRLLLSYFTMGKKERKALRDKWSWRRKWKRTKKCKKCGNRKTFRDATVDYCIMCGEIL